MNPQWLSLLQTHGETVVILCLFWFLCAAATAFLASNRGKRSFRWFAMGLLMGPMAFLFAARPPLVKKEQYDKNKTSLQS